MSTSARSKFAPHPCNPAQTQHNWAVLHSLLSRIPLEPISTDDQKFIRWDNTDKKFEMATADSSGCQDAVNFVWDDTNNALGIGIATPSTKAILDLTSTLKGFLPPRMTTTQRDAITSPPAGLVIYNTTTAKLNVFTTAWEAVTSA